MAGKVLPEQNSRTALTLADSGPGAGGNRRWPQVLAAAVATLGGLSAGSLLAWSAPALPLLTDPTNPDNSFVLSEQQGAWIGAVLAAGAALGALPAGLLADRLGRRLALTALALPLLAAWLLAALAAGPLELAAGRLLGGAAVGAVSVVAPTYVAEVAEPAVRGALGALFQLQITAGVLLGYAAGLAGSARALALICAAVPAVYLATVPWLPESPAWLAAKGRGPAAARALRWLRGPAVDTEAELRTATAAAAAAAADCEPRPGAAELLLRRGPGRRALLIALGLMAVQQLSGVNAVIFNMVTIFREAGSSLRSDYAAIVAAVVQVLATGASSLLVDRAGRRPLLLLSATVMAVCQWALAASFQWPAALPAWLPLAAVAVFFVVFSLGLGPVPWLLMAELFSPEAKGAASAAAAATNWLLAFVVTCSYEGLRAALGQPGTFLLFGAVCAAGAAFVLLAVPETKGKPLRRIQAELAGRAQPTPPPSRTV